MLAIAGTLAALAGPVAWPEGEHRRWLAVAARESAVRTTPVGPDAVAAAAVALSVLLDCVAVRGGARIEAACRIEDAGLRAVAAEGVDPVALGEAVAAAEARIEATAARVVLSRAGRLLEVEALEADGALWSEFAGLSSWLARALSPMDAREARPGRRRWSQRAPVAGRLFGGVDATGLTLRLSRDGDGLVGRAAGRWDGDPPLRVELVSEHLRAADGLLARGRVDVRARARREGPVVYAASAEVRALGAAGVRALGSEVVGEIEVGWR